MMKRIQRRVRHSDEVPSALKRMTFDRNTFVQCSQRMKSMVPTLNRPKTKKDDKDDTGGCTFSGSTAVTAFSQTTSASTPTEGEQEKRFNDNYPSSLHPKAVPSTSATHNPEDKQNTEDQILPFDVEVDIETPKKLISHRPKCSTLTYNQGQSVIIAKTETEVTRVATSTLPATFRKDKNGSGSMRRMWLKPITKVASLMSTIGDNLDIAAYPSP